MRSENLVHCSGHNYAFFLSFFLLFFSLTDRGTTACSFKKKKRKKVFVCLYIFIYIFFHFLFVSIEKIFRVLDLGGRLEKKMILFTLGFDLKGSKTL